MLQIITPALKFLEMMQIFQNSDKKLGNKKKMSNLFEKRRRKYEVNIFASILGYDI
jgi:hypothetical protein